MAAAAAAADAAVAAVASVSQCLAVAAASAAPTLTFMVTYAFCSELLFDILCLARPCYCHDQHS